MRFAATVEQFAREGGRGLNVTVPFKLQAFALAHAVSERAEAAGACNTLKRTDAGWYADNTDGAGIVHDLTVNLDVPLAGRDILVLGRRRCRARHPGPAVRGRAALGDDRQPHARQGARTRRALRRPRSGRGMRAGRAGDACIRRGHQRHQRGTARRRGVTVAGWHLPARRIRVRHDLRRCADRVPALRAGAWRAPRCADGLGMLVEQAAESFLLWRGVRPATAPVFALLRPPRR